MWLKIVLGVVIAVPVFLMVSFMIKGRQSRQMQPSLGLVDGRLAACPAKPNCISSHAPEDDETHYIEPVRVVESPLSDIRQLAVDWGWKVVKEDDIYLHLTVQSKLFGFVDDVEFFHSAGEGLLHFRSASRVGYSDLGANRKRLEKLLEHLPGIN